MTLQGVRKGDIVQVAERYAMVTEIHRGVVRINWLGTHSTRAVRAREIEAHWRRSAK